MVEYPKHFACSSIQTGTLLRINRISIWIDPNDGRSDSRAHVANGRNSCARAQFDYRAAFDARQPRFESHPPTPYRIVIPVVVVEHQDIRSRNLAALRA